MDTGSGISVIGGIFFDKYLREEVQILPVLSTVSAANAQRMTVRGDCELEVWIGMLRERTKFRIIEDMGDDVLLGTDDMNRWKIKLDLGNEEAHFGEDNRVKLNIAAENELAVLTHTVTLKPNSLTPVKIQIPKLEDTGAVRLIRTPTTIRMKRKVYIQESNRRKRNSSSVDDQ